MVKVHSINFNNIKKAFAVRINSQSEIREALSILKINTPQSCLVLVGGAGGMSDDEFDRIEAFFREVIAPLAESHQLILLDGGTDAGVMRLIGKTYAHQQCTFPLIGIAAVDTVFWPGRKPEIDDACSLEPNHPFFILTPGKNWGDESEWVAKIATEISRYLPSITLLINGGEIALQDVARSIDENRQVLAVAGSGRKADAIAAALFGEQQGSEIQKLVETNLINTIDLKITSQKNLEILMNIFDQT